MEQENSIIIGRSYYEFLRAVEETNKLREKEEALCNEMKDSVASVFIDCGLIKDRNEITINLSLTPDKKTCISAVFSCSKFNMAQIEECLYAIGGSRYLGGFDVTIYPGEIDVEWNIEDMQTYKSSLQTNIEETTKYSDVKDTDEISEVLKDSQKNNVKIPSGKRRITSKEESKIIRLYKKGLSTRQIGLKIGRDRTVVRDVLRRNGVEIRYSTQKKNLKGNEDEVVEAYIEGMSTLKIKENWNISDRTLYRILKKNGVTPNRSNHNNTETKED